MIKVPYSEIIDKITKEKGMSSEELELKVKSKMDQLAGLITKEGAAHIIANELGIKLFEQGAMKINQIRNGMRSVETVGKVTRLFDVREFNRKDGSSGKVASFVLGDESGSIRVVLWNDQTEIASKLSEGLVVKIKNGFSKENNNAMELHLASKSEIEIDPSGSVVGVVEQPSTVRKKIEDLQGGESSVELLGTIVSVFEPRFFETCPSCGKRARARDGSFVCDTHNVVTPQYGSVLNLTLDDGSANIRTVFFRNQLSSLLSISSEELLKYKDQPNEFETKKNDLLGTIIKVTGRANKNEMFDRIEFITQTVDVNPNANEELKKLEQEAKVIE